MGFLDGSDYIVGGKCGFIFEGFNEVNSQPIRVDGDRNFWRRLLWSNCIWLMTVKSSLLGNRHHAYCDIICELA